VGRFGEVQVMDWGLAAASASTALREEAAAGDEQRSRHRIIGTPTHMAPEQARGEHARISPRTDVFALGSILCEILTGRPAYRGPTRWETYLLAREASLDDALAALGTSEADAELVELARECLARAPEDRPKGADAVHLRISRYLTALEERAYRSDLEAAEARAEARSERRTRRLTLALGLLAIVVLSMVLVQWSAGAHRQAQLREVEQHVRLLFDRATQRRAQLAAANESLPAQWDAAISETSAAWRMAQAEGLSERFTSEHAELDRELKAGRERVLRERELLARLDAIRPHFGGVGVDATGDLGPRYVAAFAAFDIDV